MLDLQNKLRIQGQETINIISLVQMVMDQRTETEEIFLEAMSEAKGQLGYDKIVSPSYKGKLSQKVVVVTDLDGPQREVVLKNMFNRINMNYQPVFWREVNLQ